MYLKRHNLIRKKNKHRKILLTVFIIVLMLFFIFYLFNKVIIQDIRNKTDDNNLIQKIVRNENKSIFNIKELNIKELKNRIILLNVYNIKDFSYIFSVDLANKLKQKYGDKIIVIDIISDNFGPDKNTIINYIIKNGIERPVLNITNFNLDINTRNFEKYFILVNEDGIIVNTFPFNNHAKNKIELEIDNILSKKPKLNINKLNDIILEKDNQPESFIKSFNHIIYLSKIKGTQDGPYFIISDSKGKKIFLTTINGNIVNQIGSGKSGNDDNKGVNSTFCYPSGMALKNNKFLYIADTCNNSIRTVDLKTLEVSTLIKNNRLLKNPLNIAILNNSLIISTASENTLLKYDLDTNKLNSINCEECDRYIIKLVKYNNKIYFINMKDYSLYSIDTKDNIKKKIDFNLLNEQNDIKIEGNNNFHIDDTGLYIVDKFKNKIIKIKNSKITNYSTNEDNNIYNFPTDIVDFMDKIYITNEDNKKLVRIDKNTKKTKIINISFAPEYGKLKTNEDKFLDVNNIEEVILKSGLDNKIEINLDSDYSFEKIAPQNLSLYKEDLKNKSAVLIKTYTKKEILDNKILLIPTLENNVNYYLSGTFYYCNYNKKTPCLINKYNRKIVINPMSENNIIRVDFLY